MNETPDPGKQANAARDDTLCAPSHSGVWWHSPDIGKIVALSGRNRWVALILALKS